MGFMSTILAVEDVLRSRELYEHVLKCKVNSDFGIYNIGFEGGSALYRKAMFSELIGNVDIKTKANNLAVYFEFGDISKKEKEIEEMNFDFVHKSKEQPWGQRVFRFYDYDGHIIEIAEKMDIVFKELYDSGLTYQEIAHKTGFTETDIKDEINRENNK